MNPALVTAMELLKLDPWGKLLLVLIHLETAEKIVALLLQTNIQTTMEFYRVACEIQSNHLKNAVIQFLSQSLKKCLIFYQIGISEALEG